MSARQLSSELVPASDASQHTLHQRLRTAGLYARPPVVCVLLNPMHRSVCLQLSQHHQNWVLKERRNRFFTDESRFSLQNDSSCNWIKSWDLIYSRNFVQRDHFAGGGRLLWAGILFNGCTVLHIFVEGTVTTQRWNTLKYFSEAQSPQIEFSWKKLSMCVPSQPSG